MDGKKTAKIAFAVVCLGAAGLLFARKGEPKQKGDKAYTHWICANEKCANEFTIPFDDWVAEKKKQNSLKCPKCETLDPNRGAKCPNCSKIMRLVGHGALPKDCPACKKPMPPPKEE